MKTNELPTEFPGTPSGWAFKAPVSTNFEIGLEENSSRSAGKRCAYIKSVQDPVEPFGNLMQYFHATEFRGKRLRMSAWVKSDFKDDTGRGQLWLRIDGPKQNPWLNSFDNMKDRPITGRTDWQEYGLVVDVADSSTGIAFGLMQFGTGKLWLDEVKFEAVDITIPLTAIKRVESRSETGPQNLDFEALQQDSTTSGITPQSIKHNSTLAELERKYDIIMINDASTTFEFVIFLLQSIFDYNIEKAQQKAKQIHEEGKAIVGSYPEEIARPKVKATKSLAREKKFPLKCEVLEEASAHILKEEQVPSGWIRAGSEDYRVGMETEDFHVGSRCSALFNVVKEPESSGNLTQTFWLEEFRAKRVRMRLWIKTIDLNGRVQPWMRVDEKPANLKYPFDNFCGRMIKSDTEWTRYESVLNITETTHKIAFGVILTGEGRVLIDDVSFEIVDEDVPTTDCTCVEGKKARNLDFSE